MKTVLLVIGKTTDRQLETLMAEYVKRIGHYLSFEVEVIPELKNTKNLTQEVQKQRETELLQKSIKAGDSLVLLDENGREFRSVEFARYLERKMVGAPRRLVFVVGGPYGFSDEVYRMAQERISLSKMTFSHQMIRLLFVEQVYRAMTILHGEPYHHE